MNVLTNSSAYANLSTSFKKHKNISKKQFRAVQKKRRASQAGQKESGHRNMSRAVARNAHLQFEIVSTRNSDQFFDGNFGRSL